MRLAKTSLAVTLAALGLTQQAHAGNLLVNGGFETPAQGPPNYATFNIGAGSTYITGWTVTQGNVDLTTAVDYGPGANTLDPNSVLDVDLIGDSGATGGVQGGLSQMFATTVGQTYSLSFDYSHNNGSYAPLYSALVSVNDQDGAGGVLYSAAVSQPNGTSPWQSFAGAFTATSDLTSLSFVNTSGGSQGGIYLDDVTVAPINAAVPEPASWAMFIGGFGVVGGMMRAVRRAEERFTRKLRKLASA